MKLGKSNLSPRVFNEALGARIRERRLELHLFQSDLAKATNILATKLSRLENGQTSVSIALLCHTARALKTDIETLLKGLV